MLAEAVLLVAGSYLLYMWFQDPVIVQAQKNANDTVAKKEEVRLTGIIKQNMDLNIDPSGKVTQKDFTDHEKNMEQGKRKFPIANSRDKSAAVSQIQTKAVKIEQDTKNMFGRAVKPNHSITRPGESRDVGKVAASPTDIANSVYYRHGVYSAAQDF